MLCLNDFILFGFSDDLTFYVRRITLYVRMITFYVKITFFVRVNTLLTCFGNDTYVLEMIHMFIFSSDMFFDMTLSSMACFGNDMFRFGNLFWFGNDMSLFRIGLLRRR